MKNILLIEDDIDIANLIHLNLSAPEYHCSIEHNGRDGYLQASDNDYDLIILDISLPSMDGLEICNRLRQENNNTPIIMLTARTEEIDKIIGLEIGADDYITKPFSVRELLARIKAMLRRKNFATEEKYILNNTLIKIDSLQIDLEKMSVFLDGKRVDLTPKEFELLKLFTTNPGKTYTRERILQLVWGSDFEGYEHTVNSHINRLRMKIEEDVKNPKYILTTWGVGYRFIEY